MRYGVVALVFGLVLGGALTARQAVAVKPFLDQFKALYEKPKTTDYTMQIFNLAVEKKDCGICHLPKPKKGFNSYGAQLQKLLNAKRDASSPQKIRAAMTKVAQMKSNPDDSSSATFGQRLKQGKLPVGEIHIKNAGNTTSSASAEK